MPKIPEVLAKNLQNLRKSKGLSQEALGKLIGVSRQTIWSYEKGEGHINMETLSLLASALGVEETDLVTHDEGSRGVELTDEEWTAIQNQLSEPKNLKRNTLDGLWNEIYKAIHDVPLRHHESLLTDLLKYLNGQIEKLRASDAHHLSAAEPDPFKKKG